MSPGVAVTGANGFIGQKTVAALAEAHLNVRALSRTAPPARLAEGVAWHQIKSYDDPTLLAAALQGVEIVIHLADNPDRAAKRRPQSAGGVLNAILQAMDEAGTKRIIFASSVYARLAPSPSGYGHSKALAEENLLRANDPARTILRLPPVYGPGGRGGLATLAKLTAKGLPLPFGTATMPRAYLSRDNLANLLVCMAQSDDEAWSSADGRIFEPVDGSGIATADLVRMLAEAQRAHVRLFSVSEKILRLIAKLIGKSDLIASAFDPLEVEGNDPLLKIFGWRPVEVMPESLEFLKHS